MFRNSVPESTLNRVFESEDVSSISPKMLRKSVSDVPSLIALHSILLDDSEDDIASITSQFEGPLDAFSFASILKDEGNILFKAKNFGSAFNSYKKAMILITFSVPLICEELNDCESLPGCRELIVSLHLNMAFCELKLLNFENAIHLCSLVLRIEKFNVKALYRRGCAFAKLARLGKAINDFQQALVYDPKNKDIQMELAKLDGNVILGVSQGKKMSKDTSFYVLGEDFGKANDVAVGEDSSVEHEGRLFKPNDLSETPVNRRLGEEKTDYENQFQNEMEEEFGKPPPFKGSVNRLSPPNEKVIFVNKKGRNSSLQLSRKDVEKLRNGKEFQYYNSRSMTFLKVRLVKNPHPTNLDVKMEAHHNNPLRVAEASESEVISTDGQQSTGLLGLNTPNEAKSNPKPLKDEVCCTFPQGKSTPMKGSPIVEENQIPMTVSIKNHSCFRSNLVLQEGKYGKNSPGFNASLKAKLSAIRFARQIKKGHRTTFQHKYQGRKMGLPHLQRSESVVVGLKLIKIGGKRKVLDPYDTAEDDIQSKKKICKGFRFYKLDVHPQGDMCSLSLSPLFVDGTSSSRPKLAHNDVVQARYWLC